MVASRNGTRIWTEITFFSVIFSENAQKKICEMVNQVTHYEMYFQWIFKISLTYSCSEDDKTFSLYVVSIIYRTTNKMLSLSSIVSL